MSATRGPAASSDPPSSAYLSIAAGCVHAAAAGSHGGGVVTNLLATAAVLQVGWGVAMLLRSSRLGLLLGAGMNLVFVAVWAVSRSVGLRTPDELAEVQAVGAQDGLAAVLGGLAAITAVVDPGDVAGRLAPVTRWVIPGGALIGAMAGISSDHHHDEAIDQSVPFLEAGRLADRLPLDEAMALLALSARPVVADHHGGGHSHGGTHGTGYERPEPEAQLSEHDQATFDVQWGAALAASERLATPEQATAHGYVVASPDVAGVGAHWIKWSLVDQPFDPGHPSMLLFDTVTAGRPPRLVGLSYWVASETEPDGFAGPNDEWHFHRGLCFVNAWLMREDVEWREDCEDTWIDGADLWMLHAWTVDAVANPWGRFAPTNPRLCPRATDVPDIMSCDPAGI